LNFDLQYLILVHVTAPLTASCIVWQYWQHLST